MTALPYAPLHVCRRRPLLLHVADCAQVYRPPLPADAPSAEPFPVIPLERMLTSLSALAVRFRAEDFKTYFAHGDQRRDVVAVGGYAALAAVPIASQWCRDALVDGGALALHFKYDVGSGWLSPVLPPADRVSE